MVSDGTNCGIGGIVAMDCGGNGIDVMDSTGIVVDRTVEAAGIVVD